MSVTLSHAEPSIAGVGDYIALMKPRVMSLVVFTAFVGLVIAPGHVHPVIAVTALICIAVGAGAAGALNMWYDADIDARMARTQGRPVPAGRVAPGEALAFGLTLAGFAVVTLGLLVNVVAGALLAATIAFYVLIYTMWLKRRTPQNIVIGGAAGALPPMIGWASVTGGFAVEPTLLFLIIFFWTPPHFWALSLYRAQDYARAGIPMLPVVSGEAETRRQILLYSLILAPLGASPWLLGYAGLLYGIVAVASGVAMIALALRIYRDRAPASDNDVTAGGEPRQAHAASKQMFAFSILYLFLLFAMLLVDSLNSVAHRAGNTHTSLDNVNPLVSRCPVPEPTCRHHIGTAGGPAPGQKMG
jgi:protoheme IX farnesyltransferase